MNKEPSRMEQMIDLLIQEIMDRIEGQRTTQLAGSGPESRQVAGMSTREGDENGSEALPPFLQGAGQVSEGATERILDGKEPPVDDPAREGLDLAAGELASPTFTGPSHAAQLMRRMAVWLLLAVVLINIPLNRHRVTLATAMPDTASLIVRDGLVVKEEGSPDIHVYRGGAFRWISSLDAFDHYGFTWEDVHIVNDGYLDRYTLGAPLHVLLKCEDSPHIYRLEAGTKRWIRDIDTFVAVGHVWEDVRFVSCSYLGDLPDGETIPPDAGPPPQP
jgi:hypothetical protein